MESAEENKVVSVQEDRLDVNERRTDRLPSSSKKQSTGSLESGKFDSTDHGTGSSSSGKSTKVRKFRSHTWIMLAVMEAIVIALVMIHLLTMRAFFQKDIQIVANKQARVLRLLYDLRFIDSADIVSEHARRTITQSLLGVNASLVHDDVLHSIKKSASLGYYEILNIVDINRKVVISAYGTQAGEIFDPQGIVSDVLASDKKQAILTTSVISYNELVQQSSPLFRTTEADYFSESNILETQQDGIIRYAAAPVLDDSGSKVGAVVSGWAIQGKARIPAQALSMLDDGFASIVYKHNNKWKLAVSVQNSPNKFHVSDFLLQDSKFYEQALKANRDQSDFGYVSKDVMIEGNHYHVVAVPIPKSGASQDSWISSFGDDGNFAVLVRGNPRGSFDVSFRNIVIVNIAFLAAGVIVDLLSTILAIRWFIDPLDRLVILVKTKMYHKYDLALQQVKNGMKMWLRVFISTVLSGTFLFGMLIFNINAMEMVFQENSSLPAEAKVSELGYRRKLDSLYVHSIALSSHDEFIKLLQGTASTLQNEFVEDELRVLAQDLKIEVAALIGVDKKILRSTAPGIMANSTFDPSGIVSDVLSKPRVIQVPIRMSSTQFLSWSSPRYLDARDYSDEELSSSLHPSVSKSKNVIMRFTVTPVKSRDGKLLGAFVLGALVNGKGRLASLSVTESGEGYEGIYFWDQEENRFELLSGAYRKKGHSKNTYDVEAEDKTVLYEAMDTRKLSLQRNAKIHGEMMNVAGFKVHYPEEFDCSGNALPYLKYDLPLFSMRGQSSAQWNHLLSSQTAIQSVSAVINLVASIGIAIFVFRPIRAFSLQMEKQRGGNRPRGVKVSTFPSAPGPMASFRSSTMAQSSQHEPIAIEANHCKPDG